MRLAASSNDRKLPCKKCGKESTEREVMVHSGTHSRMVTYYHHAVCLTDPEHTARQNHVKDFFERMDALSARLAAETGEAGKLALKTGLIVEIDLCYVCPDACSPYLEAAPEFTVAAHGLKQHFRMLPISIEGIDFGHLIEQIKVQASGVALSLTELHASGRYVSTTIKESTQR